MVEEFVFFQTHLLNWFINGTRLGTEAGLVVMMCRLLYNETHLGTEAGLVVMMCRLLYNETHLGTEAGLVVMIVGNTFRDRGWCGSGDG